MSYDYEVRVNGQWRVVMVRDVLPTPGRGLMYEVEFPDGTRDTVPYKDVRRRECFSPVAKKKRLVEKDGHYELE